MALRAAPQDEERRSFLSRGFRGGSPSSCSGFGPSLSCPKPI